MGLAWPLLLLLLCPAGARQEENERLDGSKSSFTGHCGAEVVPVCVQGGLWVMNRCLATSQGLQLVDHKHCSLEDASEFLQRSGGANVAGAPSRPAVLPTSRAFHRKHGKQYMYLGLRAPGLFQQRQKTARSGNSQSDGYALWNSCILEQVPAASNTLDTAVPSNSQAIPTGASQVARRASGWWHWWCSKPKQPPANPPSTVGNATCLPPDTKGENLTNLATGNARSSLLADVQPAFYGPKDDSVRVSNPVYPFISFVKVSLDSMDLATNEIYRDDVQCSGTVISRTSILTAAHCVFFRGFEDFIALSGGRVIIGDRVDPNPQVNEVAVWSYMKAFPRYPPHSFENWRFDLAILTLEDLIEDRFVTVPVLPPLQGPNCWSPKPGDVINAGGYPMEYPRKKKNQQWMHSCELVSMYPRIIRSTCDTLRGQSGGPVWFTGRDAAGMQRSIVIAIVVGGEPGPTPPLPDTLGLDVEHRIDASAYEFLKQRAGRMFNIVSQQ